MHQLYILPLLGLFARTIVACLGDQGECISALQIVEKWCLWFITGQQIRYHMLTKKCLCPSSSLLSVLDYYIDTLTWRISIILLWDQIFSSLCLLFLGKCASRFYLHQYSSVLTYWMQTYVHDCKSMSKVLRRLNNTGEIFEVLCFNTIEVRFMF